MHKQKHQPPYRGFWVILLIMILVPITFAVLLYLFISAYTTGTKALHAASAQGIGFGLGFIFHMMCFVGGSFRQGWSALKFRISEFFQNLSLGLGYAITTYWEDLRDDGMTFSICMLVIVIGLCISLDGLYDALKLLHYI
ncbi:MAG: hypothetical protein E7318_00365 [Clostridiales bacterium]|nr:hypothetical protein [Clostridiales bacterium]